MRVFSILSACLLMLGSSLSAQERRQVPPFQVFGVAPSQEDEAAILDVMEEFRDAWAVQDVDRLMAVHSEDVEWINAYARIFRGSESLGVFLREQLFPQFDPAISVEDAENMVPISLRFLGDDAAVVHWYTDTGRGPSRVDDEDLRRTHLHFVLEKRAQGWLIVHEAIFDAR